MVDSNGIDCPSTKNRRNSASATGTMNVNIIITCIRYSMDTQLVMRMHSLSQGFGKDLVMLKIIRGILQWRFHTFDCHSVGVFLGC